MTARPADPGPEGQLAARAEGEGTPAERPGLDVVHPDEIGSTTVATDRSHWKSPA
jgi:hypothetical protein